MYKPNLSKDFFTFPTRLYDPYEMDAAEKMEDMADGIRVMPEYIISSQSINIAEFLSIVSFGEGFSKGRSIDEVKEHGFDGCSFSTISEDYFCHWKKERFMKEYDKFLNRLTEEGWFDDDIEFSPHFENNEEEEEDDELEVYISKEHFDTLTEGYRISKIPIWKQILNIF